MNNHPAQLWIGETNHLIAETENYLKKIWCVNKGCNACAVCKGIDEHQHYQLLWLSPEKQVYTVAQIEEIQYKTSFKLNNNDNFYVVFDQAEALTINSCNKLLKTIEEPHGGYNFLFLAASKNILPTLISRCVIKQIHNNSDFQIRYFQFAENLFEEKSTLNELMDKIQSLEINEQATPKLLKAIFSYLMGIYKEKINKNQTIEETQKLLFITENFLQKPPMPGSLKIFWRDFFLKIKNI